MGQKDSQDEQHQRRRLKKKIGVRPTNEIEISGPAIIRVSRRATVTIVEGRHPDVKATVRKRRSGRPD
jgi:hypothetical protein